MSDQEILELLAAQAPAPAPGLVDEVLARARRARLRRHLTVWGASLGVIAVTLAAGVLVAPSVDGQHGAAPPAASGTGQATTQSATASPNQPGAGEAGAYATAIKALAEEVREGGPQWPVLYVLDHTCANVISAGQGACDPQALPASLRTDLATALAPYAPVQFIADRPAVTGPLAEVVNGGVLVTLGRIEIHDDQALVPLSVQRNGLNGRGLTYRVARQGDTWHIDGTVGSAWIS